MRLMDILLAIPYMLLAMAIVAALGTSTRNLLIALAGTLALWTVLYNTLLMTSVDAFLARSRGIPTRLIECGFVVLVAVAVMLSIRWVGVMLINALLILPAAAGRNLARTARQHAAWSVGIAMLSGIIGLTAAYYLDTSAGATIVLTAAVFYAASLIIRSKRK